MTSLVRGAADYGMISVMSSLRGGTFARHPSKPYRVETGQCVRTDVLQSLSWHKIDPNRHIRDHNLRTK